MKYIYTCNNKACAEKEGAVFQLEFELEAVIDEKNIAMIFCRKCGAGLTIKQQTLK